MRFLHIFKESPFFCGSSFDFTKEDIKEAKMLPNEGVIAVNITGIYIFNKKMLEKHTIFITFEQLVFIVVVSEHEARIGFLEAPFGSGSKGSNQAETTLKIEKAREFVEDVIAYCELRCYEGQQTICALNYLTWLNGYRAQIKKDKLELEPEEESLLNENKNKCMEVMSKVSIPNIPKPSFVFHEKPSFITLQEEPLVKFEFKSRTQPWIPKNEANQMSQKVKTLSAGPEPKAGNVPRTSQFLGLLSQQTGSVCLYMSL